MALWRQEMGRCKKCRKFGMLYHTNGKQTQDYCDICQPIVDQDEIDKAVNLLIAKGVTPEMYKRFLNRQKEKP